MSLYDTTPGRVHTNTGHLLWPNTCRNLRGPLMGFHGRTGSRVEPPTPQSAVQRNVVQQVARPQSTVSGTRFHAGRHLNSYSETPDRLWGLPPSQRVPGALFEGIQRPEGDDKHSPLSSAEVKNWWSYISTPPHPFVAHTEKLYCHVQLQSMV